MNFNPLINQDGTKRWLNEKGGYHRDGDLPAIEWADGSKDWYKNGRRHREHDKPAVDHITGIKEWWKNGTRHREQDKPAVEWPGGNKMWFKHGKPLSPHEVKALQQKWTAIRNGNTDLLAEELVNEL